MGYDMHWVTKDDAEIAAVAAAQEAFNAACKIRDEIPKEERGTLDFEKVKAGGDPFGEECQVGQSDRYKEAQRAVHAAYEALGDAETSYFRLNIWGMGRYRAVMHELGIMIPEYEHPSWPKAADFGSNDEDFYALIYPEDYPDHTWDDERLRAAAAYKEAHDAVLSFHPADQPGIPGFKFGSNDGWLVTPDECRQAVALWEKALAEHGEDAVFNLIENGKIDRSRWLSWIEYFRGAADHGGFEVH